jgi:hypothetical protein
MMNAFTDDRPATIPQRQSLHRLLGALAKMHRKLRRDLKRGEASEGIDLAIQLVEIIDDEKDAERNKPK